MGASLINPSVITDFLGSVLLENPSTGLLVLYTLGSFTQRDRALVNMPERMHGLLCLVLV